MTVHDFKERLHYSEEASSELFWQEVYRQAFSDLVVAVQCKGDTQSQRLGIDRIIHLASGKTLKIDEKKREEVYSDILLEYVSVDTTSSPGWIEKDLQIDYLAYAFMPIKKVYLFPWEDLRRAWKTHKNEWLHKYKLPPAQNNGYKTLSVGVPIKELGQALFKAMIIQLTNG